MPTPSNLLLAASELLMKSSVILLAASLATYALRRLSAALNVTSRRATLIGMSRRSTLESQRLATLDEQRILCPITMRTATTSFVPVVLGIAFFSMTHLTADENMAKQQAGSEPAVNVHPQARGAASPVKADPFAKIIIEHVSVYKATLSETANFLRNRAREQGANSFEIVIPQKPDPEPHVTFAFLKMPITQAVKMLASEAGMQMRRDSLGFVLENPTNTTSAKQASQANSTTLAEATTQSADPFDKIIINRMEFAQAPLRKVVEFLNDKARNTGAKTFDIVIPIIPNPEPRVSILGNEIPIAVAVNFVANGIGVQARRDSKGFVLEKNKFRANKNKIYVSRP